MPVRLEITDRRPFASGHEFGPSGAYERLTGRAHFNVDPTEPVIDLDKAPRDSDGLVHCTADFMLLVPEAGNRRLFFDYGNRGHKRALQFFNDAPHSNDPLSLAHAGNGFLFRRGFTVAWLAWEGDILPGDGRLVLDLPIATDNDAPITGTVRVEYIADAPGIASFPLSARIAAHSYPTVSLDTARAKLTRRRYPYDRPEDIPPDRWRFAQRLQGEGLEAGAETALIPSDRHIHLPEGFQPGWIYELLYTARDPKVMGLGHLVVRDFVSALRHAPDTPTPGLQKAYAWGRSQTGRCLRDFVYRGFNADRDNRRVFDGILPHVAGAGRKWLNHRFASPIVSGGQHYEDHFNVADRFPFSYASSTDHLTGKQDAILKRPDTDPLVIHTQTSTEYWARRGSLVHTDTQGTDLKQPDTVRIYAWTGSQHFANPEPKAATRGIAQNLSNVVATSMLFRAMLVALDRWATDGTPPPPSKHPTRANHTLVDFDTWRENFPPIPGVALPTSPNTLPLLDFGPDEDAGILLEPPRPIRGKTYTILVPTPDQDGIDQGGVRAPMAAAPLATYTGWNLRARGFGHGALLRFEGSTIPLPATESERRMTGDPRLSVAERYPSAQAYVEAIRAAARGLVAEGFMLEEDVDRCATAAANWSAPRHSL